MQVILQTSANVYNESNEGLVITINQKAIKRLNDIYDMNQRDKDCDYDFVMNEVRKYVDNRSNTYLSDTACSKVWDWVQAENVKWFRISM